MNDGSESVETPAHRWSIWRRIRCWASISNGEHLKGNRAIALFRLLGDPTLRRAGIFV
ncbi:MULTISPECIES: hypothetical protein [Sorangium]|uniref:hypothetical protein n=1 Tax=Sorangium TaxID=39643 RepID=UPI003D9C1473